MLAPSAVGHLSPFEHPRNKRAAGGLQVLSVGQFIFKLRIRKPGEIQGIMMVTCARST